MSTVAYKILERRQSLQVKTYAILCLILLLSMGFYSYQKFQEYTFTRAGVTQNKEFIGLLKEKVANEKAEYEDQKADFDNLDKTISEKLEMIFPAKDDYTALTRQLDLYEKQLNKRNSPFEISSIDYQKPVKTEKANYSILPMRMNIRSSDANFTKFLHLVENSGALDDEVRLMDVSSIRLSFPDSGDEIQFSVQINAYFQK